MAGEAAIAGVGMEVGGHHLLWVLLREQLLPIAITDQHLFAMDHQHITALLSTILVNTPQPIVQRMVFTILKLNPVLVDGKE
jgi:hypothetical protein